MATPTLKELEKDAVPATAAEPSHEEIAVIAYALWQDRGCPHSSPEVDWLKAEQMLRAAIKPTENDTTIATVAQHAEPSAGTAVDDEPSMATVRSSLLRHRSRVPEAADLLD